MEGHGIGDLVHSPKVQQEILKQLQAVGRKAGLAGMEIVVGAVLSDEEWLPTNGMVTATQKLNRRGIFERFKGEVEAAYAKSKN